MTSENGPQVSDTFLDDARADADAKYDVYRKAYSAWWNAVQILKYGAAEASEKARE